MAGLKENDVNDANNTNDVNDANNTNDANDANNENGKRVEKKTKASREKIKRSKNQRA